jgi:hypothetical protein
MKQELFLKYLRDYALDALENAGESVTKAADYIAQQPRPGLLCKDRLEKRAALERVNKVFLASRERSWYVALKSLGLDDLAKEYL